MLALAPESPTRRRGRPSAAACPRLRYRNLCWLTAHLTGTTARQIAADPGLAGGHSLRTIQAGIRSARSLVAGRARGRAA